MIGEIHSCCIRGCSCSVYIVARTDRIVECFNCSETTIPSYYVLILNLKVLEARVEASLSVAIAKARYCTAYLLIRQAWIDKTILLLHKVFEVCLSYTKSLRSSGIDCRNLINRNSLLSIITTIRYETSSSILTKLILNMRWLDWAILTYCSSCRCFLLAWILVAEINLMTVVSWLSLILCCVLKTWLPLAVWILNQTCVLRLDRCLYVLPTLVSWCLLLLLSFLRLSSYLGVTLHSTAAWYPTHVVRIWAWRSSCICVLWRFV